MNDDRELPRRRDEATDLAFGAGATILPEVAKELAKQWLPVLGFVVADAYLGGWMAFLATVWAGKRTAEKARQLEASIMSAVRLEHLRLDQTEANVEDLSRAVSALRERIDADAAEDVAELYEQTMRSSNDRWLAYLRAAARRTVAQGGPDPTRHLIIRRLRDLTPEHVDRLRVIANPNRPKEPVTAIEEALMAAGFAEMRTTVSGGARGGIAPSQAQAHYTLLVNQIGRQALELLDEGDGG